ncbi:MAG: polysaccharide deacetylase family protein [Endomicrobium sp.]|jgi:peptidoglycan/xylan/chitin deacetylase (PgdA/CDA1 family)|nr:polysaccharide deacetylase family protein [Endomicrobium sp.]
MKKFIVLILLFFAGVCFAQVKTFYSDGSKDIGKVALTFDDGPGKATEKILEILEEKNVKASFFMLGVSVQKNPAGAKAVAAAGHEVANHTYGHINFYAYKDKDKTDKMEKELLRSENIIKEATGVEPFLVRFPYGYSKSDAVEVAKKYDCCLINWSFGCDWEKITAGEMHDKYKKAIKNSAIFLMHDLHENEKVLSFLSDFIDEIKQMGYEIVPVSELLNLKRDRYFDFADSEKTETAAR